MAAEDVIKYLNQWGRGKDVITSETSCATVELAALALGTEPARIAKSISFAVEDYPKDLPAEKAAEYGCLLIVASGDSKINSTKFKKQFGFKASMLPAEDTFHATGHAVGGVCPFAISSGKVSVYLDVSLKRFPTVFPACGSSNSLIELTCEELFTYSGAKDWVDVCKGWEEPPAT